MYPKLTVPVVRLQTSSCREAAPVYLSCHYSQPAGNAIRWEVITADA